MAQGHIRRLITDRGFGFIRPVEEGQRDLFFHARQVYGVSFDELREGDSVSFTPADDGRGKGPVATEVHRGVRAVGYFCPTPRKGKSAHRGLW